jgi:hypothetical protein
VTGTFSSGNCEAVRRAAFISVPELQGAIEEFLRAWNENPKPFVWTATVQKIMDKISRGRAALETIQPGCWSQKINRKKRRK